MRKITGYLVFLAILLGGCNLPAESTPTPATAGESPAAIPSESPAARSIPTEINTATQPPAGTAAVPPTETALSAGTPTPVLNAMGHLAGDIEITISKIQMHSPSTGWGTGGLAGANDHVLKTLDGGNTWRDVTPPEPAAPPGETRAVESFFLSPDIAWVIYHTTSGPPAVPLALVWHTRDGGASWSASQPLEISDLNEFFTPSNLQFADLQNGWLLAHVGVGMNHDYVAIFRSSDGGQTWQRLIDPYGDSHIQSCSKNRMVFTTPQEGWLTGDCNGVAPGVLLFKTVDGGATWNSIDLPPPASVPNLYSNDFVAACGAYTPFFFDPQHIRLVVRCVRYDQEPAVSENYLYTSQDGGASWVSRPYPGGALFFASNDNGLALGSVIQKTSNGGTDWSLVGTVSWEGDFYFLGEQLGWAIARDGVQIALVQTSNGGQSWAMLAPRTVP